MKSYKLLVFFLLFSFIPIFNTLETIAPGQSITNNQTLVSPKGSFEAGFFNIGKSNNQYWGIWYRNISQTKVWVANRDTPVGNSSGVLELTTGGNIVILDGSVATVWSSNASKTSEKPVLQLLDSGNLVVIDGNDQNNLIWQSFDYPTDTMLPGQKLKVNLVTGQFISLTCWRDQDDPGLGEYSVHLDPHGLPQMVITKNSKLMFREGPWNGLLFSGAPWDRLSKFFNYSFLLTKEEAYYVYDVSNDSIITRYVLSSSGLAQRLTWSYQKESWDLFTGGPTDQCDYYDNCGANSICNNSKSPICECLEGFIPKNQGKWKSLDWSDGCVRRTNLSCDSGDEFMELKGMQIPDTSWSWFDKNMNLEECKRFCLQNCSCTAYTNFDVRDGGSGCLLWFDNLIDAKAHISIGQELYIRLAASEIDQTRNNSHSDKKKLVGILVGISTFIVGITILGFVIYLRRKKVEKPDREARTKQKRNEKEDIDLPSFDFSTIANVTDQFSFNNKLGEGGFGPVYKGALANGQQIAVKRLSKKSGQGPEEFKNEVMLIAKLQHRNLVKLLGYCIQNDERILIYEFMPNRSLDYFIFEQTRSKLLNWDKRFQIINGIARGLLYLHQDSRLRIIHRDLKTSNILLDDNMDPKISDFGMARTFGGGHDEANTIRVVGTHGYMPPEYAVHGSFSVKSDVFSFGVIVLEIVSGRKNREFSDPHHHLNLLGHAWRLWSEERPLELIDEALGDSIIEEVIRCIQIGLLCVQERAKNRPDMSTVVLMLNGERLLPNPKQPGFYPHNEASSTGKSEPSSSNEISISLLQPR